MNGFVKIRICADGRYFDCFQKVENGVVVVHLDEKGKPVAIPARHEAHVLDANDPQRQRLHGTHVAEVFGELEHEWRKDERTGVHGWIEKPKPAEAPAQA